MNINTNTISSWFKGITSLKNVTLGSNVTSIGYHAFQNCTGLTSIDIPENVTSIENGAFQDCTGLKYISISKSSILSLIGDNAFNGCTNLGTFTIPNSVTSIGNQAFYGCSKLTSVTALNPTPVAIAQDVFTNRTNATLYVPKGSKEAYQAANYWKEFKEIKNITLPTHKLIYMVDGEKYKSYYVEEGESIIPEKEPTKEGYTFSGWSEIPETMPAHDVTVTGTFTQETGINQIMVNQNSKAMIFTIGGKRVDNLKKGLNVIRMKDGTMRKVVVR